MSKKLHFFAQNLVAFLIIHTFPNSAHLSYCDINKQYCYKQS